MAADEVVHRWAGFTEDERDALVEALDSYMSDVNGHLPAAGTLYDELVALAPAEEEEVGGA